MYAHMDICISSENVKTSKGLVQTIVKLKLQQVAMFTGKYEVLWALANCFI